MTGIEWTDQTWNPVTGCTRVSPGCDHCYMFALYPRLKGMGTNGYAASPDVVTLMPSRLDSPYGWAKPRRVFVNSMSDLFHPDVPFDFIDSVFEVMAQTPAHTYQVLTKRPGRARRWWRQTQMAEWPPHVWIGTSVEGQKYTRRITAMESLPAPVRFVSAEPLLEPLDLRVWIARDAIQWLIVGGESGARARPMELDWARDLRDQCMAADVPMFLKQLGGPRDKRGGDRAVLDGRTWREYPYDIAD